MNEEEKDAVHEVRAQAKLVHAAAMCELHAQRLVTYARFNQRVDARDEAIAAREFLDEVFSLLESDA